MLTLSCSSFAELQDLVSAVDQLIKGDFRDDASSDSDEDIDEDLDEVICVPSGRDVPHWTKLTATVCRHFDVHIPPPVALGSKAESLVHKASAMLHSLFLECRDCSDLVALLRSVQSFTTDMGTELGLSDTFQQCLGQWFPVDFSRDSTSLSEDTGMCEQKMDVDGEDDTVGVEGSYTFANALPWPGMMHVLHNCAHQVHEVALQSWPWFHQRLKAVSKLFTRRWSRERFVEKCIKGTRGEVYVKLVGGVFKNKAGDITCSPRHNVLKSSRNSHVTRANGFCRWSLTLLLDGAGHNFTEAIEWRWGTLMKVLDWLLPLKACCKVCWSKAKFCAGAGGDDPGMESRSQS
jgi:hypothetical protein